MYNVHIPIKEAETMRSKRIQIRLYPETYYAAKYMAKQSRTTTIAIIASCISKHFKKIYGVYPTEINWSAHGYGDPDPENK